MAAFPLLLLACTSLPLLSEAQLSLLGPRGRPFSFTINKDDTTSPQRAMESDIAAVFRAAAYGTISTSTTSSLSTTKTMVPEEIKVSSPENVTVDTETSSNTAPLIVVNPDIDLSKGENIQDLQHNQDIIEMKSFIAMEENYRREHNRDEIIHNFIFKVSTTERSIVDTSDYNNNKLQNMENIDSSQFLSWGRIYIGVGLLAAILTLVLILLMRISYSKYQARKNSSVNTVCGSSNIFSNFSIKPELQGMYPDALEKGYFSLGMNTEKNMRTFNNYGHTKTTRNNINKSGHIFINATDSSMLVHDSGFVRIKTDTEYENLKNNQICKPVLNKYHSVAPHPTNPYSYCESRQNYYYYCTPLTQNEFLQVSPNKPLSPMKPVYPHTPDSNHCESTIYSDIYSHPSEFFNKAELPSIQGINSEASAEQFRTGFMQRLGRTTTHSCGYGYSPLEGADASFGSDEDPNIV